MEIKFYTTPDDKVTFEANDIASAPQLMQLCATGLNTVMEALATKACRRYSTTHKSLSPEERLTIRAEIADMWNGIFTAALDRFCPRDEDLQLEEDSIIMTENILIDIKAKNPELTWEEVNAKFRERLSEM